ncbi:MAG: hypothetical protein K6F28_05955, partial [Lachnospiraceae bacterium]|nr:hypothetical protein [Lachnospiraceae bacterium]
KCRKGIHLLVGDESKITEVPTCCFDLVFFVVNRPSSYGSVLYFEELSVSLLVFLNELAFLKFGTQLGDAFVKSLLVISTF